MANPSPSGCIGMWSTYGVRDYPGGSQPAPRAGGTDESERVCSFHPIAGNESAFVLCAESIQLGSTAHQNKVDLHDEWDALIQWEARIM